MSPILFSVFNVIIINCGFWDICIFWLPQYLFYNAALKNLSGNIRNNRLSNIYDTILFPPLLVAVLLESIGIQKIQFSVTNKEKVDNPLKYQLVQMTPHVVLATLSCIGIAKCSMNIIAGNSLSNVIILFWLVVNLYNLIMAIFFMMGRKIYRDTERFSVELDISIFYEDIEVKTKTLDIADEGFAIVSEFPEYIPYNNECDIRFSAGKYSCNMKAIIVHVEQIKLGWKYEFKIIKIDDENKKKYYNIIYDREHSLPKQIKENMSVFEDFQLNLMRRASKDIGFSRKLARIYLNKKVKSFECDEVIIKNFNYKYILVEDILCTPIARRCNKLLVEKKLIGINAIVQIAYVPALLILFTISITYLVKGTYNPFIYFKF